MCSPPGSNHAFLYEDVRTFFEEARLRDFHGIEHDYDKDTDGGHGRIEVRQCWSTSDVAWLPQIERWAGLKSIVMVEARRIEGEAESLEQRYYLTSLPSDAQRLGALVREHWGIDNRLHWVLDVSCREDASRIRHDDGAENMGLLRRIALNLLGQEPSKQSLKGKRKRAGWDNAYLEKVLRV